MKTFTNLLISAAVLVLMGGAFSVDAFGQNPSQVHYALDSGGSDETANDCLSVSDPCTFARAMSESIAGDTIAVRVRRNGGRALVTEALDFTVARNFAVYNEDYGDEDDKYLVDGELELRGAVTIEAAGAIDFGPYEDFDSWLTISASTITVTGGGTADLDATTGPDNGPNPFGFTNYLNASTLRGDIVIGRNTKMTLSGSCPTFENLEVASGVTVEVEGTCTNGLTDAGFTEQDGLVEGTDGIYVWNVLDVQGTLMLNGLDLHLIAPRPNHMADSMYAGVSYTEDDGEYERGSTNRGSWPRAEIDGMITSSSGLGTMYLQVQEEVLTDTTYMNIEQCDRDDDGDCMPGSPPPTVDTLVTVMPSYTGWQNEHGHAYRIYGDGRVDLNVMKTTQAGVRLEVDFGTGATSENNGGVLYVNTGNVSGDFENNGFAQTQFVGRVNVSNSIVVTGPELPEDDAEGRRGIGNANANGGDRLDADGQIIADRAAADRTLPQPMLECHNHADRLQGSSNTLYFGNDSEGYANREETFPHMLGSRGLSTGIYFGSDGNVISGAAELTGGVKRADSYYKPSSTVWTAADGDSTEVKFSCYGGLLAMGSTTIMGDVIGDAVTHVLVNDNVMLEGDYFDVRNAEEVVIQNTGRSAAGLSNGNICTSTSRTPLSAGPHLVFAGSADQTLNGGGGSVTLDRVGLRIDKGTSERVELSDMMVSASTVDIRGGLLTTNGMLNVGGGALYINQDPGSVGDIRRGSSGKAYAVVGGSTRGPADITYTGDLASMDTGDELYEDMSVDNLVMWLGTAATELTILENIEIDDGLYLSQGTLSIPSGVTLTAPSYVEVGNGYIDGDGAGTWELFSSLFSTGTVVFKGKIDRTLSNILPSYTLAGAKSATVATVYVDGCPTHRGATLIYDGGFTLSLQEGHTPVGNLYIRNRSKLDLAGNTLVSRGNVSVAAEGWLCDSSGSAPCSDSEAYRDLLDLSDALEAVHYEDTPEARVDLARAQASYESSGGAVAKVAEGDGMVYFHRRQVTRLGVPYFGSSTVSLASNSKRLDWYMPNVVVGEFTHTTFDGGNTASTTGADVMPNMADRVMFPTLSLTEGGEKTKTEEYTGARVTIKEFDRAMVGGDVMTGGKTQLLVGASGGHPQAAFMVGGDMSVGGRVAMHGGVLAVTGDFSQSGDAGSAGGFASDVWLQEGAHYQMGDFYVGAGVNADTTHVYSLQAPGPVGDHGTTCMGGTREVEYKGAMRMVNAGLMLQGDYAFHGAGDAFDADQTDVLGLRGTVTFVSSDTSMVSHSGAMNSFCNVAIISDGTPGMVMMGSDVMQNEYGELTLKNGLVSSGGTYNNWVLANEAIEDTLVGRISIGADEPGVVRYGSRDSYVDGYVRRSVSMGNQGGGVVTGGYLFPVGNANESGPDFYRPLIMQFPADLGSTRIATAGFMAGAVADSMDWPEDNLTVDGANDMLMLNSVADMFWKLTLDAVPAHDPNIRLAADELHNIFDIDGLRIIQWDCDGTNPRLAGVYDLDDSSGSGNDDESFVVNDFVNGIPNLTQEGINVGTCNIFGIAGNLLQNPIGEDPITSGTSRVQFINNVAGATMDLYIDNNRVVNDFAFQTARAFGNVAAGTHMLDVVPANAPDNSVPILSLPVRFRQNMNYHVIAHGNLGAGVVDFVIREDVRVASTTNNMVDFYFVHGAAGLGEVDIRIIDPIDNTRVIDLLANNFSFDQVGTYMSMDPGGYNFEITTANNDTQIDVFRLEIQQYANLAFVLNLSGTGKSSADGVTMMGVAQDGNPFFPQVITGTENSELPTEFALLGNYPNPFNPSTRIEFDLPETAEVSIALFDILGRNVMTLPAKEIEAGASRSIELNAASLASGNYFYRVVATGASGRHIETGQMMLIK